MRCIIFSFVFVLTACSVDEPNLVVPDVTPATDGNEEQLEWISASNFSPGQYVTGDIIDYYSSKPLNVTNKPLSQFYYSNSSTDSEGKSVSQIMTFDLESKNLSVINYHSELNEGGLRYRTEFHNNDEWLIKLVEPDYLQFGFEVTVLRKGEQTIFSTRTDTLIDNYYQSSVLVDNQFIILSSNFPNYRISAYNLKTNEFKTKVLSDNSNLRWMREIWYNKNLGLLCANVKDGFATSNDFGSTWNFHLAVNDGYFKYFVDEKQNALIAIGSDGTGFQCKYFNPDDFTPLSDHIDLHNDIANFNNIQPIDLEKHLWLIDDKIVSFDVASRTAEIINTFQVGDTEPQFVIDRNRAGTHYFGSDLLIQTYDEPLY